MHKCGAGRKCRIAMRLALTWRRCVACVRASESSATFDSCRLLIVSSGVCVRAPVYTLARIWQAKWPGARPPPPQCTGPTRGPFQANCPAPGAPCSFGREPASLGCVGVGRNLWRRRRPLLGRVESED